MTRRDEAIKKIATSLFSEETYNKVVKNDKQLKTAQSAADNALLEKCASASLMLKTAAKEIRSLKYDNEKLAANVEELTQKINYIERHDEAKKLANVMVAKGMLKASEVDKKTMELMAFDEEGFSIFKDAIENVSTEKIASHEGISNLDFMYSSEDDDVIDEKPSLIDGVKKCL